MGERIRTGRPSRPELCCPPLRSSYSPRLLSSLQSHPGGRPARLALPPVPAPGAAASSLADRQALAGPRHPGKRARHPAPQEPSQSSGASGAAKSPPPPPEPANQQEARRLGLPRSPSQAQPRPPARAPRPPWLHLSVPRAGQTPCTLTGDRFLKLVPSLK